MRSLSSPTAPIPAALHSKLTEADLTFIAKRVEQKYKSALKKGAKKLEVQIPEGFALGVCSVAARAARESRDES